MSAPTEVPTHADLMELARTQALLATDRLNARSFSPGFMPDVLLGLAAAIGEEGIRRAVSLFLATFFRTASGEDLDELARDHFQLERQVGKGAIGQVLFSRASAAAGNIVIPVGTLLQTAEGIQFQTTEDVIILGLEIEADIQARVVGVAGHVAAATIVQIVSTLDDATITVSNPEKTAGGVEAETDAEFRERIRGFLRTLRRGTVDALIFGAKQVGGVTEVAVQETSKSADSYKTGGTGIAAEVELDGPWHAKTTYRFVELIVHYGVTLANGETLTINANLQDATDGAGSGAADLAGTTINQLLETAPGAGGPHDRSGVFTQTLNIEAARAFIRSQVTLLTSGSGTPLFTVALRLIGEPSEVKVYIADSAGGANQALVDAVTLELENWRAAGVRLEVIGATVVQQAISLTVTFAAGFDTSAARDAIVRAVVAEVNALTIGQTLFRSRIVAAAGSVAGVLNVVVANPVGDVVPVANQLVQTTAETVTFA